MRLQLTFSVTGKPKSYVDLMFNYQYPLSAALYSVFNSGDSEFAYFLHNQGYSESLLRFKFFSFSQLYLPKYKVRKHGFELLSDHLKLTVSILPPKPAEAFVRGLFSDQTLRIGQLHLKTQSVELIPEPEFETDMQYKTLSPLIVSHRDEGRKHARYIHPGDPMFGDMLKENLENKHRIYSKYNSDTEALPEAYTFGYRPGRKIQQKRIIIKEGQAEETSLIVYHSDFSLTAPPVLQRIGYYAGFGEKNALGLGCCEII